MLAQAGARFALFTEMSTLEHLRSSILTPILAALLLYAGCPANALSLFGDQSELLNPDDAFAIGPVLADPSSVLIRITAAEGYYLYDDKFSFESQTPGVVLGNPDIPPGETKRDEFFGLVETHRGQIDITVPILTNPAGSRTLDMLVGNQGCADIGVCFPPQQRTVSLDLPPSAGLSTGTASELSSLPISEQDQLALRLGENALLPTIALFFLLGILLAFTPCVFPMIPILSGIIAGQGTDITTRKAMGLSLVYVLAMALTYALVGVLVGLSGSNIQALFQTPWLLYSFAALYVLLSLSMFGFYELQLPSALQTRLTRISEHQQRGTHIGVAVMGVLSALIVGPCITAPLVGILIYISTTGNAVVGGLALFFLALGMGAPLVVIGTSAGKWLPQAGAWMNTVKAVFGVLLLAMAIWMIDRVASPQVTLALSGVLALACGVYLGAFDPAQSGWQKLWKAFGMVGVLIGAMWLVGAATGTGRLTAPLAGLGGNGGEEPAAHLPFAQIDSLDQLQASLEGAAGRQTMLDFYADWCVSCKEMEFFTFSDPAVAARMSAFQLVQADVTENNPNHQALLKAFGLFGPPAIVFFDAEGREIEGARVVGFQSAERFLAHLNRI